MNGHRFGPTPRATWDHIPPVDVPLIDGALRSEISARLEQARTAFRRMRDAGLRAAEDGAAYRRAADSLAVLLDAISWRVMYEVRRPFDDDDDDARPGAEDWGEPF